MQIGRRILNCAGTLVLCNIVFIWFIPPLPALLKIFLAVFSLLFFVWLNISPSKNRVALPRKLHRLGNGCELLYTAAICAGLQLGLYFALWRLALPFFVIGAWVANIIICFVVFYILLITGGVRVFVASTQLTLTHRIVFIALWLIPVANIITSIVILRVARREYRFLTKKCALNQSRKMQQICKTKYPIVLVHGIFFRDWQHLSYWGRIPKELEDNGAVIHYGHQQSSASVEESAEELKAQVLKVLEETGAERVNIIAHSKGGLDSRYAISQLGLGEYVASLTTINTPHSGCRFAKNALNAVPDNIVDFVSAQYNKIFSALGDDQPDFFSGVSDLTDEKCAQLNSQMPDCEGVLYQSFGSKMQTTRSASFPLNLGHSIIHPLDGDNDGLVAIPSMPWGNFTMIENKSRRGISHADMIDLTKKDIPGFDVCELYVGIVSGLREQGL